MTSSWRAGSRWRRRGLAALVGAAVGPLALTGCNHGSTRTVATTTTVAATTTTSTTLAPASSLVVVGVRPGVQQKPFYPQITVTKVSCGLIPAPATGRFVRLDLPSGALGTPARSALTEPTALIVVPGGANILDKGFKVLYTEKMKSIVTTRRGALVLSLEPFSKTSTAGLSVQVGALQVNGDFYCPGNDAPWPGT